LLQRDKPKVFLRQISGNDDSSLDFLNLWVFGESGKAILGFSSSFVI
jgi:hypothetical protein